jgi:hypothetical protein
MSRSTPFDLVFAELAAERFPAIREALAGAGHDPRDRDAFLLSLPAMTLLRDLRPDDSEAGEGVRELAALAHHAYLAWDAGLVTWCIDLDLARAALIPGAASADAPPSAGYLQVPERLVWAALAPDAPAEPLDGCFVHSMSDGTLRVLGIFGMHPGRMGFSVAEAAGVPGAAPARPDGGAPFSPVLAGGTAAGIHSLVGPEELVDLAGRLLVFVSEPSAARSGPENG